MYDYNGKVAVVTGAAQGIGACIAERFLREGADVVMLDLKEDVLVSKAAEIDPEREHTMVLPLDVADYDAVADAFRKITERYGKVDILVNNAGITRDAMAHKMTPEQFDMVLKVSLYGAFNCSRQVIAGMKERNYGRIISLSSLANRGNIGQLNYSSAKAAIVGFTKTLSMELAANGITVNCVAPGMIYTDIIKTVPDKVQEQMKAMVPAKRFGQPEEVANLVAFLASDEAAYISGQSINITGGWH